MHLASEIEWAEASNESKTGIADPPRGCLDDRRQP
jgi:hypothetical protein